jgi:hypothetical protein
MSRSRYIREFDGQPLFGDPVCAFNDDYDAKVYPP